MDRRGGGGPGLSGRTNRSYSPNGTLKKVPQHRRMWNLERRRLDFEFHLSHLQACDLGKSYELTEIQFLHLSNSNIIDHS